MWGHSEKVTVHKPGREPFPETKFALELPSLHNSEKINVCGLSHPSLWHFVMAAQADYDTQCAEWLLQPKWCAVHGMYDRALTTVHSHVLYFSVMFITPLWASTVIGRKSQTKPCLNHGPLLLSCRLFSSSKFLWASVSSRNKFLSSWLTPSFPPNLTRLSFVKHF